MNLISQETIQALGWTILHSLWQAAIIAILLVISLIVLRKNSSKMRYFVTSLAMLTVLMVSIITYVSISRYQNQYSARTDSPTTEIAQSQTFEITLQKASPVETPFFQTLAHFGHYFEQHLPFIVTVWFIGVVLLALRFLGAFAYLQRLKHHKTQEVSEYWKGTLKYLSSQVGVKQSVQLFESALVQVPMVIGHFKPVILLPLGALTGLSQHQIESILAHELAHIKRHDYLINILQSLLEIVLFFNPFVWWISTKIREEREN
ncbi:MAG: M56 family metallopeptidase, partial [Bacteroidota bacterium]